MLAKNVLIVMISIILAIIVVIPSNVYAKNGINNLEMKHIKYININLKDKIENKVKYIINKGIVSHKYIYIPNFYSKNKGIGPLYKSAPAPMGLADYGLKIINGQNVFYSYKTPSIMGYIYLNDLYDFYMLGDSPYTISIQLNAVLNNVTIGGNSSFVFWTQNVVDYSIRTNTLQFVDNIWNFSSTSFNMTSNSIYSGNGTIVPGIFYYAVGPTIKISMPFILYLYLNTTIIDGKTAVFFNYTVLSSRNKYSGTYDEVLFNSTYNTNPNFVTPYPYFYVSGNRTTPSGLLNDAEMIIGGAGGGSNTNIYNLNGTIDLKVYNTSAKKMEMPPSLWDVGSDTGETAMGIAVSPYTGKQFYLNSGPSFIYMVYGEYPIIQGKTFVGAISPTNSFVFISRGKTFNISNSTWLPLGVTNLTGMYSFTLPNGSYSILIELSDYKPVIINNIPTLKRYLPLVFNYSYGIYTPLYAFSNKQLENLSKNQNGQTVGNGTIKNPYIIINNQYGAIKPEFGLMNDFGFPVFSGIMFLNINYYVKFIDMPSFLIYYQNNSIIRYYNLPDYNYLNIEFYNDSHIIFTNDHFISGWFPNLSMPILGSMILWNVTNSLIASNTFYSEGISLYIYNAPNVNSNNVIWGNYFKESQFDLTQYANYVQNGTSPIGLYVDASGNIIYNNCFEVNNPAVSPNMNIYFGNQVIYKNKWNISKEPLNYTYSFDGENLTGNIFNTGYQGGNFWINFNGKLPFNNYGQIQTGGDYIPLTFYQIPVNFVESGLPPNMIWSVKIYIPTELIYVEQNSTSATITFYLMPGLYLAYIQNISGYIQNISEINLNVQTMMNIYVSFKPLYSLNFVESGLPQNSEWGIYINNNTYMTNKSSISIILPQNYYHYYVISPAQYKATKESGNIYLNSNMTIEIKFYLPKYTITFIESGLPQNIPWYVNITGPEKLNSSALTNSISFTIPNGTYEYRVGVISNIYYTLNPEGTFVVGGTNYSINIQFLKYNFVGVVKFIENGLPNGTSWSVNINNISYTSNSDVISINLTYGKYSFNVFIPNNNNYTINPSSGIINLNSPYYVEQINFTEKYYQLQFITSFNQRLIIYVNGIQYTFLRELTLNVTNGTYIFNVQTPDGYSANPQSGKIIVSSLNNTLIPIQININVNQILYKVTFTISGLPEGQQWSVYINNQYYSTYGKNITVSLPYGNYYYTINLPSGYSSTITNGTITAKQLSTNPTYSIYAFQKPINIIGIQMTSSSMIVFILMIIFFILAIVELVIIFKKYGKKKQPEEWKEQNIKN
ncbi:MAG: thermopsin family protease [Thermoplasmata archaeon]